MNSKYKISVQIFKFNFKKWLSFLFALFSLISAAVLTWLVIFLNVTTVFSNDISIKISVSHEVNGKNIIKVDKYKTSVHSIVKTIRKVDSQYKSNFENNASYYDIFKSSESFDKTIVKNQQDSIFSTNNKYVTSFVNKYCINISEHLKDKNFNYLLNTQSFQISNIGYLKVGFMASRYLKDVLFIPYLVGFIFILYFIWLARYGIFLLDIPADKLYKNLKKTSILNIFKRQDDRISRIIDPKLKKRRKTDSINAKRKKIDAFLEELDNDYLDKK